MDIYPNALGELEATRYAWFDALCKPRTAALVPNTKQDNWGHWGGYMREYTYDVGGVIRRCEGSTKEHPGFGFLVNHFETSSSSSLRNPGLASRTVLKGRHHAIHEFVWDYPINGQLVRATVHWFFATGQTNPVWSVTYDLSALPANALKADSRAPYGDLQWDGGAGAPVEGVGWGDDYQFTTLKAPLSLASGWDYTQRNVVPFDREWSNTADAEMGIVQTQVNAEHGAGGFWFYESWGERRANGPMPQVWNWPYQLNQYQLAQHPNAKLLAWGTNYGAVGQLKYNSYGEKSSFSGYPYQSYATHIVLDKHSRDPVLNQVRNVEAAHHTQLVAEDNVQILRSGPAGVARTDEAPYSPEGYNPVYATWELKAHNTEYMAWQVRLPADSVLKSPTFVIHNWHAVRAPNTMHIDGMLLHADKDFFASLDDTTHTLWITVPWSFRGTTSVQLGADRLVPH